MFPRIAAHLRAPLAAAGPALTLVLLVLDARREWRPSELILICLLVAVFATGPAAVVDSSAFRPVALVCHTVAAGIVALGLVNTTDKRALWTYALSALVSIALPASRPALTRVAVIGVGSALVLTLGLAAPALAWDGGQHEVEVCTASAAAVHAVRDDERFDPADMVMGYGSDGPDDPCVDVLFDLGATADDAADVTRRYAADPRVVSVTRIR